ncbi:transforming growth factor-beta receptor-associated protein 1-like isoform X1 [Gossypium australe]|uniref:Transforming growth factor-beta receptor-associated protein 1-like isoform X1 n=1 Tax=Gossypium australe TaxID=47621 RepID=A0A5B6WCI0_9ROSI|nr:transforming growth factor-beta receptor-associated protein 1-like isoform X1 [Gossypium australe]
MAKLKSRIAVEPFAHFDLPTHHLSISTLSLSQSTLYVGTRNGSLLLLSLNPTPTPTPNPPPIESVSFASLSRNVSLLRTVSVSGSPVESIFLLSEIGVVLVLSDGFLFITDSLLIHPVKKLGGLKGVSVIARRFRGTHSQSTDLTDNASNSSKGQRILDKFGGVRTNGVKSKDLEQNREGNYVFALVIGKKLMLIELVLSSDLANASFVILREMQCFDGVKSMVWLDDSIIVGTINGYSLFSCVTGQSGVIFSLPDLSRPPLLKPLWRNWEVLLLVDNVGVVVDALGQPVGGSLVFRKGGPDSIGDLSSYVVVVRDGKMDLYHKKSGNCVQTLTFGVEGVGQCIVADEENRSGEFAAVATPTKVICYRKVPSEEQIKDLLRKKNFNEAISLVEELECEGELSKEVLSLFHAQVGFLLLFDLHFKEAVDHFLQSETMQPSEVFPFIMRDPNRWSLLVPRNRYWGLHPPPVPLEDVVDDGLLAIQRAIFLRKAGVETVVDERFLSNPPTRAELLESAIKNIIRYLEVSRQKDLTLAVKEGVDTLLMYLYRALNYVDDMEKLASSENNCIVEELETLLDGSGHLRALAFLYASKGMSSKSLAIWRILARNYSSGLWKDPAVEIGMHDGACVTSGRETAATEASKILEDSSDQDLVLQHLAWIADLNPALAVRILTSEKRTNQLSPDEVIAAIDPKKVEILQCYLQWLIEEQDSDDTRLHTLYALSLAKSAIESFNSESSSQRPDTGRQEHLKTPDIQGESIIQSPVRDRLQIFLQSSDLYDPEEVLDLIQDSELWLEKVCYSIQKIGTRVIGPPNLSPLTKKERILVPIIYILPPVRKLEDSEAAEQYCAEIGRPDAYMQLLDMYLDPQDGKEPMFKAAVRLLHNRGESLDPLQVLETLSPDMPLQLASETILRMLRARLHHHRQGQIVHYLSRAVHIDARLARLEERSRLVQINDESLCDSCHARLGTKLFAMYPDDTVVCYKCFRRQGESTSVTGRDFKQDVLFKPGWLVTR